MGTEPEDEETPVPGQRSKTPTWVGKVTAAKDAEIEAERAKVEFLKDVADEQREWLQKQIEREKEFLEAQLNQSFAEREARSKALYEISEKDRESKDLTIKRLWIGLILQGLIIAALSGITVTGKIPFIGDIGLDGAEKAAKPAGAVEEP